MSNAEAVRSIQGLTPEYKGRWMYSLTDLANIYARGNQKTMREFIRKHVIPPHYIGKNASYCIIDVQEAVSKTRWRETE